MGNGSLSDELVKVLERGKVHADPRLIPMPGFVIKTWMNDDDCMKVFINVCSVKITRVLGKSANTPAGDMYGSKEEAMDAVRSSSDWCILSKKVFLDTDKKGSTCRVIHCGIEGFTLEAAQEDKRFKMVLIASILSRIVDDCNVQIPQDLERIKLPKMKSKGILPSVADWGVAIHEDGDVGNSSDATASLDLDAITLRDAVGGDPVLVEGKTKRLNRKKIKEQPYSVQYNGVPVHSVSVSVAQMVFGTANMSNDPSVYTRGSKVYIESPSMAQPLCIETNLMLNGRSCTTAIYKKEEETLFLEIPIISFGDYIAL